MSWKCTIAGVAAALALGTVAAAADFGAAPANYEYDVEAYFADRLTDPRAARYQFTSAPYRVLADFRGSEGVPCWAVDVRVKSRLPDGGYGGYMPYTVLFVDGAPIALEGDAIRLVRT